MDPFKQLLVGLSAVAALVLVGVIIMACQPRAVDSPVLPPKDLTGMEVKEGANGVLGTPYGNWRVVDGVVTERID